MSWVRQGVGVATLKLCDYDVNVVAVILTAQG